ncbi:replicase, partial [Salmonella enterica subsp. enterica serovar Typhimurium]
MSNVALKLLNDRLPHIPYFTDELLCGLRIAGKERAILAKYFQF